MKYGFYLSPCGNEIAEIRWIRGGQYTISSFIDVSWFEIYNDGWIYLGE